VVVIEVKEMSQELLKVQPKVFYSDWDQEVCGL
jgi:hypothetical protein